MAGFVIPGLLIAFLIYRLVQHTATWTPAPIFHRTVFGYKLYRWMPTLMAVFLIVSHAVMSPVWYRVATGTNVYDGPAVPRTSVLREARGLQLTFNDLNTSETSLAHRAIQTALDRERGGTSRAIARGFLPLPPPTVAVATPIANRGSDDVITTYARCEAMGEKCHVGVQSDLFYVHIARIPGYHARTIINAPVLKVSDNGLRITQTVTPFGGYTMVQNGGTRDNRGSGFPTSVVILQTTDGEPWSSNGYLYLLSERLNALQSLNDERSFAPVDLDIKFAFASAENRALLHCQRDQRDAAREDPTLVLKPADCIVPSEDFETFGLADCEGGDAACPTYSSSPVDDFATLPFVPVPLDHTVNAGFITPVGNAMFEIANHHRNDTTASGLIDIPDRAAIVSGIIKDYLTITGLQPDVPEFQQLLAANPDLQMEEFIAALEIISPTIRQNGVLAALARQPQLWAWHSYAHHIGPELLIALSRDLVQMGLARPY